MSDAADRPELGPITPMPIDEGIHGTLGTIVLFGGSFDPVHRGHVELGEAARAWIGRSGGGGAPRSALLVFVPAAWSPLKADEPRATGGERVAMLRIALEGRAQCAIWTDELDRAERAAGPSYMIDTARRARAWMDSHGCRDVGLRLLIGADQARAFHRWREARALFSLAPPVVMGRPPDDGASLEAALAGSGSWSDAERAVWGLAVAPIAMRDVSATALRGALAAGRAAECATDLDPRVAAYIRKRGLYAR